MSRYFGTDGFRGEANINLTADHAYKVGRFLGWYYTEQTGPGRGGRPPRQEGPPASSSARTPAAARICLNTLW